MKIVLALIGAAVLTATQPGHDSPTLVNTCLITDHVAVLVDFYQRVLALPAQRTGDAYAEFHTGAAVLAIFSAAAQEAYIPGSARPAHNASTILEFRVGDVDHEFARLQPIVHVWIKKPATTPWHTRSFYFRDPDGNLVDFYAPASR
jgi:catechol 2,3-dioxygenase-like lactoylglutathione lyase family enzyme